MTNAWDEMKKAKEDEYFERKNREALDRLSKKKQEVRMSPVSGEPMEQIAMHGVVVDRCPTSGGIWLDAGELEALLSAMSASHTGEGGWLDRFSKGLGLKR